MAIFICFKQHRPSLVMSVFDRLRIAEEARDNDNRAVVKIQSWFRGTKVRAYIKFLHQSATVLQRHFRGHVDRAVYRQMVKEHLAWMREKYYNEKATLIQKVWRGYYTRKYVFNYYSRKKYLLGLMAKNEAVRQELDQIKRENEEEARQKEGAREKASRLYEARKTHYLISTHQIPGVYASPYSSDFTQEMELRNVRPLTHRSHYALRKQAGDTPASTPYDQFGAYQPLPPIGKQKPQGPFRSPDQVFSQRHKPLNPSLRVATNFRSVEEAREALKNKEWVERVIDEKFIPFTHKSYPYEPLLHTTSVFGSPPYGTKHFREEEKINQLTSNNFQTVVSPIPVFEQFNKTY